MNNVINERGSIEHLEHKTCGTVDCQRDPVVSYRFTPGTDEWDYVKTRLCLQCYRSIMFAAEIPWGDETDNWHDKDALQEYIDNNTVVTERGKYR